MREFLTLFGDWLLRQSVTESMQIEICAQSKYPPAEPGALRFEPLKAAMRGR